MKMNMSRMVVCVALAGILVAPLGCGKQDAAQVRDGKEKVAIAGAKASPKREAVAANVLQNRAGVIYIVNGQEPFSGLAQDFYGNGQMQWEAEIETGKVTTLKRWHQNGVLELSCRLAPGALNDISTAALEMLQKNHNRLDGEFSAFYDNGQKLFTATFARGQPSGDLTGWRKDGNLWIKASFANGALSVLENYNGSGQIEGKAGFNGADFIATFYWISAIVTANASIKELHGDFTIYHKNGQMALQRTYENGNIVGETREWTPEGTEIKLVPLAGLIRVAPGTFQMGSPASEADRLYSETQHSVTISKEYWLGRCEVTQGEWHAVMGSNPSRFSGDNRLPVEQVSWTDAMEFCKKVTDVERNAGRLPSGYAYILPTEAQWEYACRAGSTAAYAGELDSMAWYRRNSGSRTHPVGTKRGNAWGFQDMHGNVWEWCLDYYGGYPSASAVDPVGPAQGSERVLRGGSWQDDESYCRSAKRFMRVPDFRSTGNYDLGFRLCLAPVR